MGQQVDRLYTAEQVRRLDQCAIEGHGIPGYDLMERAGSNTWAVAREAYPQARNVLVFCGGGNNGGDGYVVARLASEAGLDARVCALKDPAELSGDAATAARLWRESGGVTEAWPPSNSDADLVFDALLGTGLDRAPAGAYGDAVEWINASGKPVVAVDIPSGLNADTGVVLGCAVKAELTATFIGAKRGLYTADGPDQAGRVHFYDLDTPQSVRDSEPDSGILIQESFLAELLPVRKRNTHKGSFGWLLGVGGNSGMSGAVRLAGEAALRSGAGKVTLVTLPAHASLVNLACPELMVRGAEQTDDLRSLLDSVDAIVTGTGLGQDEWARSMLQACLSSSAPVVIDADGLNLLARAGGFGSESSAQHRVLTPHPAEAGRLLGRTAREVQSDRVAAALETAARYESVVALKGCGTVIADSKGRYAICPFGNPGMATAGSGDVLSGVIGALLAQGLDAWQAAQAGVLAHALAGDRAASQWGERGLMASDITNCLPQVLNPA